MTAQLHALAKQLAAPVARGDLSRAVADASLLIAALDAERAGKLAFNEERRPGGVLAGASEEQAPIVDRGDDQGHHTPAAYSVEDIAAGLRHTLTLYLDMETTRREVAAHRIRRLLQPMIAGRKPPNVLLAEAHGLNGEAGFPFTEPEVTDLVTTEVYYALPPAPRARRRVG